MTKRTMEPSTETTAPVAADKTPAWRLDDHPVPAPVPDGVGYYQDADWIRVECDWESLKPRPGFESLWAEIDVSLTFGEALAIPLEPGTPMATIYKHIVNRVRAWNVREWDPEAGALMPVPPPSEIGIEAFLRCRPIVGEWLATAIKFTVLRGGPNRGNVTPPSDAGPSGTSAAA